MHAFEPSISGEPAHIYKLICSHLNELFLNLLDGAARGALQEFKDMMSFYEETVKAGYWPRLRGQRKVKQEEVRTSKY